MAAANCQLDPVFAALELDYGADDTDAEGLETLEDVFAWTTSGVEEGSGDDADSDASEELTPSECGELQEEEREILVSIYGDDCIRVGEECVEVTVRHLATQGLRRKERTAVDQGGDPRITLTVLMGTAYPMCPPVFELNGHGYLTTEQEEMLYLTLYELALERKGTCMVYDMAVAVQEHLDLVCFSPTAARMPSQAFPSPRASAEPKVSADGSFTFSLSDWERRTANICSPAAFMPPGQSLATIVRQLTGCGLVVRHAEVIMQPDIARRHALFLADLKEVLGDDHEGVRPMLGFHGTRRQNMASIVETGLIVPGQRGVRVANGSAYGVGVYLSPNPLYSTHYSCGELFVCAAIPGRQASPSKPLRGRIHSYWNNGDIMVFYSAAQVLPLYVVHIADSQYAPSRLLTSAAGAVVRVRTNNFGEVQANAGGVAAMRDTMREARLSAAQQRAAFFNPNWRVIDVAPVDDDDDEGLDGLGYVDPDAIVDIASGEWYDGGAYAEHLREEGEDNHVVLDQLWYTGEDLEGAQQW